jgi:hypothetical protein
VKPVNLINTLHATFFNHQLSTTLSLLSRLEENLNCPVTRDLVQIG